jgi:hypothetical protein
MTYFLDFRTRDVGGAAVYPNLLEGDGTTGPDGLQLITPPAIPRIVASRNLLFVVRMARSRSAPSTPISA